LWFRCFRGTLTAAVFEEFLSAMLDDFTKPIELIMDRHPAHRAASVRRFLVEHKGRIRAHYLPGYAPDMNPDEHVWAHLKGLLRSDPLEADEDIGVVVKATMKKIQQNPARVRRFFGHPEVAYVKEALAW
jgi:transposase